jgi:hypothetical protein
MNDYDLQEQLDQRVKDLAEALRRLAWAEGLLIKAKSETELLVSYFERDRQVVLHANDVVPASKKWLAAYAAGPEKETKE